MEKIRTHADIENLCFWIKDTMKKAHTVYCKFSKEYVKNIGGEWDGYSS